MSEAMTFSPGIPQGYPVFMPNQVLSNEDLNALVAYFQQQGQLTRSQLIGWGIVHGLGAAATSERIEVTAGIGLTAVGHMLVLPSTSQGGGQSAKSAKALAFAEASHLPQGSDINSNQTIFELFEHNTEAETRRPLPDLFSFDDASQTPTAGEGASGGQSRLDLKSYVLMVMRDRQDSLRPNTLLSYNATGQDRQFLLRFFLVPQALVIPLGGNATPVAVSGDVPQSKPDTAPAPQPSATEAAPQTTLPPTLYRLGYSHEPAGHPTVVRLSTITHKTALTESYRRCCELGLTALKQAITTLFKQMSALNAIAHLPISVPEFEPTLPASDDPGQLQYFYAYLGTVLAAYGELADAIAEVAQDAPRSPQPPQLNPTALSFLGTLTFSTRALGSAAGSPSPLSYLLLGGLKPPEPGVERYRYRQVFTPAPVDRVANQRQRHHIEFLIERLRRLCQAGTFEVPTSEDIRVTPGGDRSVPLGQQAIPYYLKYDQIYPYWSYEGHQQGTGDRLPAYFVRDGDGVKPRPKGEHLIQVSPGHPVYRIEGHLGQSCETVLATLEDYRQSYNLAFEVVCLRLADPPSAIAAEPAATVAERPESRVSEDQSTAGDGANSEASEPVSPGVAAPTQPHDFAQFARRYPGMEPLGGVPKGGTFILVYVETGEGQEQIVADFALPGAIGTEDLEAPPTCRIRLPDVDRQDFSEADSQSYPIQLSPDFGTASGPGVVGLPQGYGFQPSQLRGQVADEQAVVITGRWGRHSQRLIVNVHALPNPQFRFMGLESGPDTEGNYKTVTLPPVGEPIKLEPVTSGGEFTCALRESSTPDRNHLIQEFPPAFIAKEAQAEETYIITHKLTADWGAPPTDVYSSIYVYISPPTQTNASGDAATSEPSESTDQGDRPVENSDPPPPPEDPIPKPEEDDGPKPISREPGPPQRIPPREGSPGSGGVRPLPSPRPRPDRPRWPWPRRFITSPLESQSNQGLNQPIASHDLQVSLNGLAGNSQSPTDAALRPEEWQTHAFPITDEQVSGSQPSAFFPVSGAIAPNALTDQTSAFIAGLVGSEVIVESEAQGLAENRADVLSESMPSPQPLIQQTPLPQSPKPPQIGFWQRWRQSMSRHY